MQTIIVDMTPGFRMPTIYYSQGDVGTQFAIDLRSRFGDSFPAGTTVTIQATKPSGFGFSVAATSVTNGVATFTTTAEMTDEFGRFPAELKVTKTGLTLFSANFYMDGEENTHPDGTIDGQQETVIPELAQLVERVEDAASSVLDMTVEAETLAAGSDATYSYDEETNTATFGIPKGADGSLASGVLAPTYSSSSTYAVGDYVYYSGSLYRCTTAITTAEAWTSGHWTQVALAPEVSDLKSDFDSFHDKVFVETDLNLLKYDDISETEVNGLTYSIVDGVFSISGTSSASTTITIPLKETVPAGNYYFNNFITYSDVSKLVGGLSLKTASNQYITLAATTNPNYSVTVTSDEPVAIILYIGNNKSPEYTWHFCLTTESLGVDPVYPEKSTELAETIETLLDERYSDDVVPTRVVCWGDSLTDGTGASDPNTGSFPVLMQTLITNGGNNLAVENAGIGGEGSFSVAVRQGSVVVEIEPTTIPASGGVAVANAKWNGRNITLLKRGGTNVTYNITKLKLNPSSIAGVSGNLLRTAEGVLTFTRSASGSAVTFNRPTKLIVNATENYNLKSDISVIWVGTNNTGDSIDVVITCIKNMIATLKNDKYIILGLTSKNLFNDIVNRNFAMANAFGKHFLNIRDYLLAYGLDDANITPTTQDTDDIANGEIPTSLRSDSVHLNDYSYPIVANQVYKKGQELGYWL